MATRAPGLTPAFDFSLNLPVEMGCVAKYDGKVPSLTASTSGGKVMIHQPHDRQEQQLGNASLSADAADNLKFLTINNTVTALQSGPILPKDQKEFLLVGTQTNLKAYDVIDNKDMFEKNVPDGINSMTFGTVGSQEDPLAIVGGNCSIQGFDYQGNENFWTVTGDNVTALSLIDIDEDGQMELLVGSEDYEIRIFQNEEVITETTETDKVLGLCPLENTRFGYSLGNGTVGVYDRASRVWRFKSKHQVTTINAFDINSDGVNELVSGWSSGKLEVRKDQNGALLFKDSFPDSVQACLISDYRMDGRTALLVASAKGDVRGYIPLDEADVVGGSSTALQHQSDDLILAMLQDKQNMEDQIARLETQLNASKIQKSNPSALPPDTKVDCHLRPNSGKKCVELVLKSPQGTVIKGCIVTAEFLFGSEENCFVIADQPTDTIVATFSPEKDVATELKIQALVGLEGSNSFHTCELTYKLPKFAMYVPVREFQKDPQGSVVLRVNERVNRVQMWLNQSFNVQQKEPRQDVLEAKFVSLRNGLLLGLKMTSEKGGEMTVQCNDMEIAGEIIQDLCGSLAMPELESKAEFPEEFEEFKGVLVKVDEYNAIRLRLTAEMADNSQHVKALVIKAEDARILNDMKLMRKMYQELFRLNQELINNYKIRANNHHELLAALKEVNGMIQKAARLRVGTAKTRVITECRNSIKQNNIQSLFRIIRGA